MFQNLRKNRDQDPYCTDLKYDTDLQMIPPFLLNACPSYYCLINNAIPEGPQAAGLQESQFPGTVFSFRKPPLSASKSLLPDYFHTGKAVASAFPDPYSPDILRKKKKRPFPHG